MEIPKRDSEGKKVDKFLFAIDNFLSLQKLYDINLFFLHIVEYKIGLIAGYRIINYNIYIFIGNLSAMGLSKET